MTSLSILIVARSDIGMRKGKTSAQSVHAALGLYKSNADELKKFIFNDVRRVVTVKVTGLEALREVERKAQEQGLPTYTQVDEGLTQVEPGSATVLAVGPAEDKIINKLSSTFKLL
jgi:PTH2 family peptidyl-tRNA hydrolase